MLFALLSNTAYGATLGDQVRPLFEDSCYRCHGQPGQVVFGNFDYVLDFAKLRTSGLLDLKQPEESTLYRYIDEDYMPQGGPPLSQPEKTLVLAWIKAGAPDASGSGPAERTRISEQQVRRAIRSDLEGTSAAKRASFRYLTLHSLWNSGQSEASLEQLRQALGKLLNSLSWAPRLAPLSYLDPQRTIVRLDLRDVLWNLSSWEAILAEYPYALEPADPDSERISQLTSTVQPVIRADWFVATASVPPLYHRLLDLPLQVADLERRLGVHAQLNIDQAKVIRAGFRGGDFPDGSGVSRNNRVIERHATPYGAYWKSYDFRANSGTQDVFSRPLGPGTGPFAFVSAGGEMIFHLPNGLQGYLLTDGAGARLDQGPSDVVQDPFRKDKRVTNGTSCMNCHAAGMRDHFDQIAPQAHASGSGFPGSVLAKIDALYRSLSELKSFFGRDSARTRAAQAKLGIPESSSPGNEPVFLATSLYEAPVTFAVAAAELGVTPEFLRARMSQSSVDPDLRAALDGPGSPRDRFATGFAKLAEDLRFGIGSKFPNGGLPQLGPTAQLFRACANSDLAELETALKRGGDPSALDELERTPLHVAADRGFSAGVSRLLREPRVRVQALERGDGRTALSMAVAARSDEVVRILLGDTRSSVLTEDARGFTPLSLACRIGDEAIVQSLLAANHIQLILNQSDYELRRGPLHWAAVGAFAEIVQSLVKQPRTDLNAHDLEGHSPLRLARAAAPAGTARDRTVKILSDAGARE